MEFLVFKEPNEILNQHILGNSVNQIFLQTNNRENKYMQNSNILLL